MEAEDIGEKTSLEPESDTGSSQERRCPVDVAGAELGSMDSLSKRITGVSVKLRVT